VQPTTRALRTLNAWYGYSNGAADLFAVLAREQAGREPPAFMASHPATQERMEKMKAAQTPGALLPLPVEITAYLAAVAAREQI
jgi:predicted Zn-dependent protease